MRRLLSYCAHKDFAIIQTPVQFGIENAFIMNQSAAIALGLRLSGAAGLAVMTITPAVAAVTATSMSAVAVSQVAVRPTVPQVRNGVVGAIERALATEEDVEAAIQQAIVDIDADLEVVSEALGEAAVLYAGNPPVLIIIERIKAAVDAEIAAGGTAAGVETSGRFAGAWNPAGPATADTSRGH